MMPKAAHDIEQWPKLDSEPLLLVGDSLPVVLSLIGRDYRFKSVNTTYRAWLGLLHERIDGRQIEEVIGAECFDRLRPHMARALTGERVSFELWLPFPAGGRFVRGFYVPVRSEENGGAAIIELLEDITRHKDNERRLRLYQEQLAEELAAMRTLHEVGLLLVRQGDLASLMEEILQAAIAVTGCDMGTSQLTGPDGKLHIQAQVGFLEPFLTYFDQVEKGHAACGTALASARRVVIEDVERSPMLMGKPALQVVLSAGVRAIQATPLVDRTGAVIGVLSTHYRRPWRPTERDLRLIDLLARQAADLIEKMRFEEALKHREAELEIILRKTPFLLTRCSRDLRYEFVSRAYARMLARTPSELAGKFIIEIIGERAFRTISPYVERVLRGEEVTYEAVIEYSEIGPRIVKVHYTPDTDSEGQVIGWVASIVVNNDGRSDPGTAHQQ